MTTLHTIAEIMAAWTAISCHSERSDAPGFTPNVNEHGGSDAQARSAEGFGLGTVEERLIGRRPGLEQLDARPASITAGVGAVTHHDHGPAASPANAIAASFPGVPA